MRLFLALWPDRAVREQIQSAGRRAVAASGGRPVPAANLHLTLAFLGEVEGDRQAAVERAAVAAAETSGPFELALTEIGVFERVGALWLGGPAQGPLATLVRELDGRLSEQGFDLARKHFRAHVTLARKVAGGELSVLGPLETVIAWAVSELALVASVTDPAGARYEVLGTWPLGGPIAGV
jgi:RNA 2',3'-cyclic 3'-phosphodiesterase